MIVVKDCVQALEEGDFRASRLLETIVTSYPFSHRYQRNEGSMGVKFKPLSRRTFLRGAGVALGLPLLEGMLPLRSGAEPLGIEKGTVAPVRAAYLYFPNGALMDAWIPKETGADYELPFSLTPLKPVRDSVVVLSGLDKPFSRSGDGHYAKTANFLTGLHVHKTTGQDLNSGGVSVDQVAAERVGHLTPLPSLELATDPVINGLDRAVNYTRMYGSYISWRKPNCRCRA